MNIQNFFNNCNIIQVKDKSREWLKARHKGIGGSDASVILKMNKYKTPYDLFMEKKGLTPHQGITSEAIERGNRMEAPLIDLFYAEHPEFEKVDTKEIMLNSKEHDFMNASLDGAFTDGFNNKVVLEIKTATIQNMAQLSEWGTKDEYGEYKELVPMAYYCQLLHYMAVTGFDSAVLYAHLRFGWAKKSELIERWLYRDEVGNDIEMLIYHEEKFWNDLINNQPPPFIDLKGLEEV